MTDSYVRVPFSAEQVASLNGFQHSGVMHPFTCSGGGGPHSDIPGRPAVLVASTEGWSCPVRGCQHHQGWAHGFMADWSWQAAAKGIQDLLAPEPGTPAPHRYLSTSCLHASEPGREDLHGYCGSTRGSNGTVRWTKTPAQCKFCGAPCICPCHASPSVPVSSAQDSPGESAAVSGLSPGAAESRSGTGAPRDAGDEPMAGCP